MRIRTRLSATKVLLATTAAGLALAGCAAAHPGSAAVVGDARITESTVTDQMQALNEALGRPVDAPSEVAARGIVQQEVTRELIEQTAEKVGVTVAPADVDEAYRLETEQAGGEDALAAAAAQAFVPRDQIKRFLATRLLFSAMAERLAPNVNGDAQELTRIAVEAVIETGDEAGVQVAPRYGEWSPSQLQIVPITDPVSEPAEAETSPFGQLQVPQ